MPIRMFTTLRSLRRPVIRPCAEDAVAVFEPLERRELLSGLAEIVSVVADNRGRVVLTASEDLQANTIIQRTVQLFTAGADGLLGTEDDAVQARQLTYDAANRQIIITANLSPNARYRVVLDGDAIRSTDGSLLDGEFNGAAKPSGDGVEGGDYEIFVRAPVSDEIVRFTSEFGTLDIRLLRSMAPLSVQNFLNYANRGVYDSTFIHRSVENFVIQGGGFTANNDFTPIPTDPPVVNEFGLSNIRGTVAYAKFGSDPNSATSQFFFNLGNNSENLDNQNGGFTVFAQVLDSQSLSVMDLLAAFEIVNAAAENSAFNEIPVVDAEAFEDRGELIVSDLIRFTRVALLMDVSGEASQQPPSEGQVDIVSNNGQVTVRLFDLSGSGLLNATDFVNVRFGSGSSVSQIQLLESGSNVRIGIQILGANSIGSIVDRRTSGANDVAFIVADAAVNKVNLTQRLSGSNINGFILPGGVMLPDDIDGDGFAGDSTSLYVQQGFLSSLVARNGISGDVVVPGGIGSVKAMGDVRGADFVFGSPASGSRGTSFNLASVFDSSIRSGAPLRSVVAGEWLSQSGARQLIEAPSLGKLTIKGGAGATGHFEADLNLTQTGSLAPILGGASIKGGLFRSNWTIAGNAGAIKVGQDISQWTLDVTGDGRNIQAAAITASEIAFGGRFNTLKASTWDGGRFEADTAKSINITGARAQNITGDLNIEIVIENEAQQRVALGNVKVPGNFNGGEFTVTRGELSKLAVGGVMRNVNLRLENGGLPSATLGEVYDSELTVFGTVRSLRAVRWDGGQIGAREFLNITMTGDRNKGLGGDMLVNELRSDNLVLMNLQNGGDFQGDIFTIRSGNIIIDGDARNGLISVGGASLGTSNAIEMLRVNGAISQMDLRTVNSIGTIMAAQLIDSGIYLGITTITGLPDTGDGVNAQSTLGLLRIEGVGPTGYGMVNSFVVAGRINGALITEPQIDNFGRPFGVATQSFGIFSVRMNGSNSMLNSNSGPQAFNDFEVRTGFAMPA